MSNHSHNRNFRFIDFKHTHSSLFADGISGRLDNISIVLDSQIYIQSHHYDELCASQWNQRRDLHYASWSIQFQAVRFDQLISIVYIASARYDGKFMEWRGDFPSIKYFENSQHFCKSGRTISVQVHGIRHEVTYHHITPW